MDSGNHPLVTEERVAMLWADILAVELVRPGDDFFKLGGDSLMATTLIALIEEQLGVVLQPVAVFQNPRLKDFAEVVAAALDEDVEQGVL